MTGYPHGCESSYRMGCGCDPCVDSHRTAKNDRRDRQLALFPEMAAHAVRAHRPRPKLPDIPVGLDLHQVRRFMTHPDRLWRERARCARRGDMCDRFHEEVVVQRRADGTESMSAAGDYVEDGYQAWCDGCPVRPNCVASALSFESARHRSGYWGSTPTQRVNIAIAIRLLEPA